jgi:shikimate kinase
MWFSFIGFMGSGKSTAVRRMRQTTGRTACDLDDEIQRRGGLEIAEIFEREGERGFRKRELAALGELREAPTLLLATGGGVVESPAAIRFLRSRGVVFWLDAPWEVLRSRLQKDESEVRPLVDKRGWVGLRRLYGGRLRLYAAAADFRLRTDRLTTDEVAQTALLRGMIWRRRKVRGHW